MLMTDATFLSSDGRSCDVARRRRFENSRAMPPAFGPDHFVRVHPDSDGVGMRLNLRDHFHIVEIGEDKLSPARKKMEAEPAPKIDQTFLRMAVEPAIPLHPAKLDRRMHQLKRQSCRAELFAHRQPLDLGEVGEITDADAAGGFLADIADQMRCRHVIPIEFFLVWAFLLADIDRASEADDPHQIVERARDRNAQSIGVVGAVTVIRRGTLGRPHEFVEMGRDNRSNRGTFLQPQHHIVSVSYTHLTLPTSYSV